MFVRNICVAVAFAAALTGNVAFAVNVVNLPSYDRKPVIDGEITAQERDGAGLTSLTLIGGRSIPRNKTLAVLLIAEDSLYVGFECRDTDPSRISAVVKEENGPVFDDDSVQLLLTPSQEGRKDNYYHFAVNAAGVRYSNYMKTDEPVSEWQSAVKRRSWGWSAEMLVPLKSFGGSADSLYWRANIARHQMGDYETSCWVDPGTTLHNYRRFGFLKIERASEMARLVRMTNALVAPTKTPALAGPSVGTPTTSGVLTPPTGFLGTVPVTGSGGKVSGFSDLPTTTAGPATTTPAAP